MSYTTEQLEYQKQLDQVNKKLNELNALLSQHPELKTDYSNNFSPEKHTINQYLEVMVFQLGVIQNLC